MPEGKEGNDAGMTIGTECINIPGSVKEMRLLHYGKSVVGIEIPTKDLEGFNFNMPVNIVGERIIDVPVNEKHIEGKKKIPSSIQEKFKTLLKIAKKHDINIDEFLPDEKPRDEKPEGTVIDETFPSLDEHTQTLKDTAKELDMPLSQLNIFKYFSENPDTEWFEFSDIHEGAGLSRSTANDALTIIHDRGFIQRGVTGTYKLTETGHDFIIEHKTKMLAEKPPEEPPQTSPKVAFVEEIPSRSLEKETPKKETPPEEKKEPKSKAEKVKEYEEKMRAEGNARRPCKKCEKKNVWGKKTLIPSDHVCFGCEEKVE